MKTKLIKINDIYTLLGEDNKMIASDDIDFQSDYKIGKLSKQNCDEIFGVVDVDKLTNDLPYAMGVTRKDQKQIWMDGFNKAMELNKDKLFTVEDMEKLMFATIEFTEQEEGETYPFLKNYIQSLQQPTEIDVEVEMESEYIRMGGVKGVKGSSTKLSNPAYGCKKTDENGCLILKKI
jgi:hypothetical protein